jgi:lipopolysaccharide export system protein LptA
MNRLRNLFIPQILPLPIVILIFIFCFNVITQSISQSQTSTRLELIHSDVSRGIVRDGIPLKILEGNVHARQDTLELLCDRAIYNELKKILHLNGHIRLSRGRDTLIARDVRYFEESKVAIAEGDVQVFRPKQQMQSDYLEYHYDSDQIRAKGNLFLQDFENLVYVTADMGEYLPDKKYTYVRHNSHLWRIDSASVDTVHIFSDQLTYYFGETRRAVARDSVHIYQNELHAVCDSAIYYIDEDVINLESQPKAVQKNNTMYGHQMQLILQDRELKLIRVSGHANAISVVDSILKKENRLAGKEIIMFVTDRKLDKIYAVSNARSFYYLKEKEEDRGINVASADTIKAFLKDNELDSIAVIGGSQGTFYPHDYKGKIIEE